MTTEIGVRIFRSLFVGRDDAYGLESSPSAITVREPFTDSLFTDHLKGTKRVGRFLTLKDNTVKCCCVDLDTEDKFTYQKIVAGLIEKNFYPYVERSKSKGYHIWVFFDVPVEAKIVRNILSRIMKEMGCEGVEIFPKQDRLSPDNGLGNFVFLPLQGESVKNGRTVFVKFNLEPFEDQWEYLSGVHLTKVENVFSLAEAIPEEPKEAPKADHAAEGTLDVSKYLAYYNVPFKLKQEPTRTLFVLGRCLFSENHTTPDGNGDSAVVQGADGKLTYFCFHQHCHHRTWADARKAISGDELISQFIEKKPGSDKSERRKADLGKDLRAWIESGYGTFHIDQFYREFNVTRPEDKLIVRVTLNREVAKGTIEKGTSMGQYVKVDQQADRVDILGAMPTALPIKWPGALEEIVKVYPQSIVCNVGSPNSGKTAFNLNTAYLNRDLMEVVYFLSEMGEQVKVRLQKFDQNYSMKEWNKIDFRKRTRDFHQVIRPNALNIVDYLEVVEGKFFMIGDCILRIYEKLDKGIALITLQMNPKGELAWGGPKTLDKASLYFTLDQHRLTIKKGKAWANDTRNPDKMSRLFTLVQGCRFQWGGWDEGRMA